MYGSKKITHSILEVNMQYKQKKIGTEIICENETRIQ